MITGEEIWIQQLNSDQEYDAFFKKIRKAIKKNKGKIRPLKILKPRIAKSPFGQLLNQAKLKKTKPAPRPKPNTALLAKNLQTVATRNQEVEKSRKELLQEIEDHEEQKVDDAIQLEEQKASIVQSKINDEYGSNKQLASMGLIAVVGFVGLVAAVVYIKSQSHKNQLKQMQQQLASINVPN